MHAMVALVVPLAVAVLTQIPATSSGSGGRMPCGSCVAPTAVTAVADIAPESEPGERMIIAGHVFGSDGRTALAGVTLFLYQTDATGHYNAKDDPFQPRLHGWVRTDKTGQYEFHTVKPGPYPGKRIPAHIHVHIFGPVIQERFLDDFNFLGDPLLTAEQNKSSSVDGTFSHVVSLERGSDGTLRGTRDIRVPSVNGK
jgi:protocatechuate 3,4-dioxygenase beta subunit